MFHPQSVISDQQTEQSSAYDVAILIVTYNSEGQIRACLQSAIAQRQSISQEIIVVDNNSQDRTVEKIKTHFPAVKIYESNENWGFAKACNFAAKMANASYLLLLNPDTIVLNNAIGKILSFARLNPEYGFYGGKTLKGDGHTLERSSCWGEPTLWSTTCFAFGLSTIFRHNIFFDPESLGTWKRDSVREVGVITGCFLLSSDKAWKATNGFDEHYWLYGEDVDLSIRARKLGFRPVIFPEAIVIHEIGQSSTSRTKMIWLFNGKISLIKNHWQGSKRFLGICLTKLGVFLRSIPIKKNNIWKYGWQNRNLWENGHNEN